MKKAFAYLLVLPLLLCTFTAAAGEPVSIPLKPVSERSLPFVSGEQLVFKMHYKWGIINADVAEATLSLDSLTYAGVPAFHCRAFGKTEPFYDKFFKVREDFQGWFSRADLTPLKFTRRSNEGSYECRNTFIFHSDTRKIKAGRYTSKRGSSQFTVDWKPGTFDLMTMLYLLRNMDASSMKMGVNYPITLVIDDDEYTVFFRYMGKETKKIEDLGRVKCLKVACTMVAGEVFNEDSEMYLWVSDDSNVIPVAFQADIQVGKVTGNLSSWKGLRYPFSAKLK